MLALIMAGGKGTRLAAITQDEIPKPMAVLDGKPIILRTIEMLKRNGISDFYISVGHLAEKITGYFGDGHNFGCNINYIIEHEPLGSGGALYYLKNIVKDDFVICSGDVLVDVDIKRMLNYHKNNNAELTLLTHPNAHPFDSDIVIADSKGQITDLSFKNEPRDFYYSNLVNAGLFIASPTCLDYFTEPKKVNLEHDFVNHLIKNGRPVYSYKSTEYIKDVGTEERFYNGIKDLQSGIVEKKNLKNKQPCIFFDRDGVLNKYKGFIASPEQLELTDGICDAIKLINQSNFLAICVTNQPVVARGMCTKEELLNINNKIETLLGYNGAYLDDIFYCPHHPDKGYEGEVPELKIDCDCRKPKIGMLLKAQKKYNIDFSNSYLIGDTDRDIQTGINAGVTTIRVASDCKEKANVNANFNANNVLEALKFIQQNELSKTSDDKLK